jgi:triacylglycerol lipase
MPPRKFESRLFAALSRKTMLSALLLIILGLEALLLGAFGVSLYRAGWHPGFALLLPLAIAVSWRVLIVLMSFVMSGGFRGRSLASALKSVFGESLVTLYLYTLAQPLFALFPRWKLGGQGPVIVLMHGFLCNAGMWGKLKRKLEQAGFGRVYAVNVDPLYRSMEGCVETAHGKLNRILRRESAHSCVLIGHSMGGVLSRMLALRFPDLIEAVVSIGTPHEGTELARMVSTINAGPARPDSAWLSVFNKIAQLNPSIHQLNLWSDADNIVYPQRSASLAGLAGLDHQVSGIGHLQLASNPEVLTQIVAFLNAHYGVEV